ncbi:MAG: PP2C family protein-serine/threonine phosphatase [Acidobacteriota bacterium]
MKNAPLLAIGLLGWAAFLVLFPRLDPSAGWGYALDRQAAMQAAVQAAPQFGYLFPVSRLGVEAKRNDRDLYFLSKFPVSPAAEFASPIVTSVRLEPEEGEGITIRLDRSARILGFERDRPQSEKVHVGSSGILVSSGEKEAPDDPPGPQLSSQATDRAAQRALLELVGEKASQFEAQDKARRNPDEILEYTWKAPSLGDENATPTAGFVFRKGALAKADLEIEFAPAFRSEQSGRTVSVSVFRAVSAVVMLLAILVGLAFYLVGSVDREIRHRSVILTLLALIPLQAVFFLCGGSLDAGLLDGDVGWKSILEPTLFLVFVLLPLLAVCWGVGYMLAVRTQAARVVTADLFLRGFWRTRPVARSIGWGVLLGGAAASAPYLAAAVIPGAEASAARASLLSAPLPWVSALDFLAPGPFVWILFVFAFMAPLTSAYLKKWPKLSVGLLLVMGWLFLAGPSGMAVSAWGALLCSGLIMLCAHTLYRRVDLLSVIMMAYSAQAASKAYTLVVQPAESLQVHGYLAFAGVGLMGALAWGVARWGRPIDLKQEISHREAVAQRALLQRRGERERLLAEFSVARKAQQLMLPENPPDIPGFQLAAACHPAREVGGDLYDFVPLSGGRWAIAVADVSGKGVPAALYMTLTKGLLRSVSRMSSQPDEIARNMNVHLHECARRKVFVTLGLAVLDPSSGKALCVRAGHNPLIWRQSGSGQARFLYSSGIGLGLAGSRLFDRSLAVEEVQLAPGDSLILYSDGITEAMDGQGQEYGDDRFQKAIEGLDGHSAQSARDLLLDQVRQFTGDVPQYDDMTIVVLRRE